MSDPSSPPEIRRTSLRRRRGRALAVAVLVAGLGYVAFFWLTRADMTNAEQHFGADPAAARLSMYVTVLTVDPVNESLHLRLDVTPDPSLRGKRPNTFASAVVLSLDDGSSTQERAWRPGEPIGPLVLEANLEGSSAAAYPLERFHADVRLTAQLGDGAAPAIPLRVTVWEGIGGWSVRMIQSPSDAGEIRLRLLVRRTGAVAFMVIALYALMVLIAGAALTIGGLVFLRVRRLEPAMAGMLSGMLFALPALRYALPGSPPPGVFADHLVFLWAELAVALGLLLFVASWAMDGARP